MNADLTKFLVGYTKRPFAWGTDDCSLILADWWQANHGGHDPAAHLRRAYSTPSEKDQLVAYHGGLLELVSSIAKAAGASETQAPVRGDFGVICATEGAAEIGGILSTQKYWACRSLDGIAFIRSPKIVRAWQI